MGIPFEGLDYIREQVRIRDKRACQFCKRQWKDGDRRFDVHHIDLRMESKRNYAYDAANQDKLITLCHRCHLNLHHFLLRTLRAMSVVVEGYCDFLTPVDPALFV